MHQYLHLYIAVLNQALNDLSDKREGERAYEWFHHDKPDTINFTLVCQSLGLDRDLLLRTADDIFWSMRAAKTEAA